ncbi:hypothetical protein pb186bvf_008013 [Paramecium bursaria]
MKSKRIISQHFWVQNKNIVTLFIQMKQLQTINLNKGVNGISHQNRFPQKLIKLKKILAYQVHLVIQNSLDFNCKKGIITLSHLEYFFNRVLKSAKSYYKLENFALVLDNSSIHQSKYIRERYLSKVTHLLQYQLKQQIIKYQFLNDNISQAIHQSFYEIFSHQSDKYIEHTFKIAYDILQKQ